MNQRPPSTPSGDAERPGSGDDECPPGEIGDPCAPIQTGSALLGVLWNHDEEEDTDTPDPDGTGTPDVQYAFEDTYADMISDLADENRNEKIDTIKRDGEYARRTVEDIAALIEGIQHGRDHDPQWWTPDNNRKNGQYGHTPDPDHKDLASLQDFVAAGGPGALVLAKARGISHGIADAAVADLAAIERLIAAIDQYRRKAAAAKQALETEAGRLRTEEIVALIGPEEYDESNQRIPGGSEKVKLDDAAARETELNTLLDEDNKLRAEEDTEIDRLEGEKVALDSDAADHAEKVAAIAADIDAERQKRIDRQAAINAKRTEWEAKLAEARADKTKADELRAEAEGLDRDAANIQGEIDSITAQEVALRGDPLADRDTDNPASLADLKAALQRCCGSTAKDRLESDKAQKVHEYLKGTFSTAVGSADTILKGEAANFTQLATQDAAGNVFARATPPRGTVTARAALGDGVIERTIEGVNEDDKPLLLDNADLQDLKDRVGTHQALVLGRITDGAPAGFALTDDSQQDRYTQIEDEAAADHDDGQLGEWFAGTLNGIHGTLYIDDVVGEDGFSAPRRWVFTPSIDPDGGRLRGGDPNLFRYTRNSDGTYTVVPFVDYGAWLDGDGGTLDLNLLAGVVGPDAEHYKNVDVTSTSTRLPATATYTGTAQGLAARTTAGVTASGHFTADVELNATFGANPTLGGTIDNFESADPTNQGTAHVNPGWVATLDRAPLVPNAQLEDTDSDANTPDTPTTGGEVLNSPVSGSGVTGGEWSGVVWGDTPALRPQGVYGGFRVGFTDGAAAGVYSAE